MATEKEQVQEFLSIVGKSLHQYVERALILMRFLQLKSLFWMQRQRVAVCT